MSNIKLFENKQIRASWNAEQEEWYFSVVDIVEVLSNSSQPRKYWNDLKKKLAIEGSQLSENIGQLRMQSSDGKFYKTDVLDTKGILRLIQSVPSPNAEPFKMWLAEVGNDRLNEIADPEKALKRGFDYYRAKGYTEGWINQRLQTIEMRKKLTDEWQERGVSVGKEYAILTDEMTKAWSGLTVSEYKGLKDLTKENLRDNMTDIELTLNQLAEVTTTALSQKEQPMTFEDNKSVAKRGGKVAYNARVNIEEILGIPAISPINATAKEQLQVIAPKTKDSNTPKI